MGAKSAVKLRARGIAYKCDICGRKLMSNEVLIAHQRTAHNIITRRGKPKNDIKLIKANKLEPVKKAASPRPSPKPKKDEDPPEISSVEDQTDTKKKTVEFECPKCFSVFSTYFLAHKHIQKYHCINKQGMKVPPNSPSLIQPVRIELCLKCNRKVKSIQTHICDTEVQNPNGQAFICVACDEYFTNLRSFDLHVLNLHGNEVESMFFPTSADFTKWKEEMETQTKVSYAGLDKYDSKRYYHCNYVQKNSKKNQITYFCPSTIIIQEFSKGIQVHFYKQHYKHSCNPYSLVDKYKKYSITAFLKRSEEYNNLPISNSVDNDMYLQFKTLMEGIVVDAAKINISTLKILLGKALDMTSILTNYDEEIDDSNIVKNVSQSMNDSQITEALEDANITLEKKSLHQNNKDVVPSPKILNSFSLAQDVPEVTIYNNENISNNTVTDSTVGTPNTPNIVLPLKPVNDIESPSSFNDSYKDFVVRNFKIAEENVSKNKRNTRQVVKTKIGQFKPGSPKSVKPKLTEDSPKSVSPKPKKIEVSTKLVPINPKKLIEESPKLVPLKPKKTYSSPKLTPLKPKKLIEDSPKLVSAKPKRIIEDSPKLIKSRLVEETKKVTRKSKDIEAQEKVQETPKKVRFDDKKDSKNKKHKLEDKVNERDSAKKPKLNLKPKLDITYEVKEQENDCNILILKL